MNRREQCLELLNTLGACAETQVLSRELPALYAVLDAATLQYETLGAIPALKDALDAYPAGCDLCGCLVCTCEDAEGDVGT